MPTVRTFATKATTDRVTTQLEGSLGNGVDRGEGDRAPSATAEHDRPQPIDGGDHLVDEARKGRLERLGQRRLQLPPGRFQALFVRLLNIWH